MGDIFGLKHKPKRCLLTVSFCVLMIIVTDISKPICWIITLAAMVTSKHSCCLRHIFLCFLVWVWTKKNEQTVTQTFFFFLVSHQECEPLVFEPTSFSLLWREVSTTNCDCLHNESGVNFIFKFSACLWWACLIISLSACLQGLRGISVMSSCSFSEQPNITKNKVEH